MYKFWLPSFFLLCLFLVACSNEAFNEATNSKGESEQENLTNENKEDIKLVASEKNLPANFSELAFRREESPHFNYLVNRVDNQKSYEKVWDFYRLEQQIPKINFEKNDIYFIVFFESGSCPYNLDKIKIGIDNQVMKLQLSEPDGVCTDDATPRTIIIEVSKDSSSHVKDVLIGQSNVETIVPINDFK